MFIHAFMDPFMQVLLLQKPQARHEKAFYSEGKTTSDGGCGGCGDLMPAMEAAFGC